MRVEHGAELQRGFFPFALGLAGGDDARAGADPSAFFLRHCRADGHGEFALQPRIDPADGRAIPATRDGLELADQPQCLGPRVATQGRRGVQRLDQRQDARLGPHAAVNGREQMLDIAELEQAQRRDVQVVGECLKALAHLLDHDLVFMAVFVALHQGLAQGLVLGCICAAWHAASQSHGLQPLALRGRQQLGRCAIKAVIRPRLVMEAVTIGIMRRQITQRGQGTDAPVKTQLSRPRQHHLAQLASADAFRGGVEHVCPHARAHGVSQALHAALRLSGRTGVVGFELPQLFD